METPETEKSRITVLRQSFSPESLKQGSSCDVCGSLGIEGVAASPFAPVSFAYCKLCLDEGAEVFEVITRAVFNNGGPSACNSGIQEMLQATLRRTGKTMRDVLERMSLLEAEENREVLEEYTRHLKDRGITLGQVICEWQDSEYPQVWEAQVRCSNLNPADTRLFLSRKGADQWSQETIEKSSSKSGSLLVELLRLEE